MASGGPPYYGRWPVGSVYEARLDGTWVSATPEQVTISATPGPSATVSTYSGYIVFKFTASGTLNVGAGNPGTADVFVVAGGATGGSSFLRPDGSESGTGGAGGARTASPAFSITANTPIPVVVGGTATNSTFGPVTSSGGTSGGAGGAGIYNGAPTPPNPGSNGPTNNYETGSPQNYGGGGGSGAVMVGTSGGSGGASGGGAGANGPTLRPFPLGGPIPGADAVAGTANTGGGGGGGSIPVPTRPFGAAGGSGVVIVRFPDTQFKT
jgi:hypothetical protein